MTADEMGNGTATNKIYVSTEKAWNRGTDSSVTLALTHHGPRYPLDPSTVGRRGRHGRQFMLCPLKD